MSIDQDKSESSPLDYATPQARREGADSPFFAVAFGTLIGMFGLGAFRYGIPRIYWLIHHWRSAEGSDVMGVLMFNLIGALSVFSAWRWIRSALVRRL